MKTPKLSFLPNLLFLAAGLFIGGYFFSSGEEEGHSHHSDGKPEAWTCSMHPQIQLPEAGGCPICGMDLIPASQNSDEGQKGGPTLKLSEKARELAKVETTVAMRGNGTGNISLLGRIAIDEGRENAQTTHVGGRIEELPDIKTGESIKKGQIIAYLYSPDLITARDELIEAQKFIQEQPSLYKAAVEKLKNWKIGEGQLEDILKGEVDLERFPLKSDYSGIITRKQASPGDHVKQGQTLYHIADLSKVWALFDIYEGDLSAIHVGTKISFTLPSLPGKKLKGTVSFLNPTLDPATGIGKARVVIVNTGMILKPGMIARGMAYSISRTAQGLPITLPKSAVLWTGKRSVVYVELDEGRYQMREVLLGADLGGQYEIASGVNEGERVVAQGAFAIDAASQLSGMPSMMSQPSEQYLTDEETMALTRLGDTYFSFKDALVSGDESAARKEIASLHSQALSIAQMKGSTLSKDTDINRLGEYTLSETLGSMREALLPISEALWRAMKKYRPLEYPVYQQYCPMALNNEGGTWMSKEAKILNPYFGKSMLRCGEVKASLGI